MEPPPGIALVHGLDWVCKEPALIMWNDPDRSEISSLGLPCPTGKPTLLTLWIGRDAVKGLHIMLHLRISVRFSKRRKVLDHFLLPPSGSRMTESTSVVNLKDASENVRQCLEEAYGKSSTKKCLHISFHQPKPGRVLMPLAPENAPCLGGTALHLVTLLRSLSCASSFDVYVGHSSYAQHALMNLEGVSTDATNIELLRSYGGNGGVFDDWRRILVEQSNNRSGAQNLPSGNEGPRNNHTGVDILHTRQYPEVSEPCVLEDQLLHVQPTCSPPPYSSLRTDHLPSTPKGVRVSKLRIKPLQGVRAVDRNSIDIKGYLRQSHVPSSSATDQPPKTSGRSDLIIEPCSPTSVNTSGIVHGTTPSPSPEKTVYSPTVVNTPSTIEDTKTPARDNQSSACVSPAEYFTVAGLRTSRDKIRKATEFEEDFFAGHVLSTKRRTMSTSILSSSSRSDTPSIRPTIFTNRHEHTVLPTDTDEATLQVDQKHLPRKFVGSFTSSQESLDRISLKPVMRSLEKELRTLVSAQLPLVTEHALQRVMNELLESIEYSQKVAEIGLQETSDNLKIELQLEKDKGVEEIDDHAEDILTDVKCQMEDLASGHLLNFEDMLQRTGEQLKRTLKAFLEVLTKAITVSKDDHDDRIATTGEMNFTQSQTQESAVTVSLATPDARTKSVSPGIADSPAAAATKLFLHEFRDLCVPAKVKVLERLTSQSTAEVFLAVDRELREAWIASWTGQDLS